MLKILVVDDSRTARKALRLALSSDPDLQVVGEADTGERALELIRRHDPDVVTMDVYLKRENGLDITARIMSTAPRPVLVITGVNPSNPDLAYRALEAGALEVVGKLPSPAHRDYEARRGRLLRRIHTLARVPVVHHFKHRSPAATPAKPAPAPQPAAPASAAVATRRAQPRVVLLGASTGGPPTLSRILTALKAPYPLPMVVVQHIAAGFGAGFADWLGASTGHHTTLIGPQSPLEPGKVYVAADSHNLELTRAGRVRASESRGIMTPCIDVTFRSAAATHGADALAVLLTGMGKDGSQGLGALHAAGATTLVQEPDSCAVSSMPRAAIHAEAATEILVPDDIAAYLGQYASA